MYHHFTLYHHHTLYHYRRWEALSCARITLVDTQNEPSQGHKSEVIHIVGAILTALLGTLKLAREVC